MGCPLSEVKNDLASINHGTYKGSKGWSATAKRRKDHD
jgi:hypothetical protein